MKAFTKIFHRSFFLLCLLFIGLNIVKGQNEFPTTGVEFLTEEEYQNLPNVDWENILPNTKAHLSNRNNKRIVILKTPEVGNQGSQGSCVGWAVGYSAMSILAGKKYGYDWSKAKRSPSYIYNQIKVDRSSCDKGSYIEDALNLVKNEGVCSYELMPYFVSDCMTMPNKTQKDDATSNRLLKWGALKNLQSVSDMKKALSLGYPVVISCYVYESFSNMWNSDGIWDTFDKTERIKGGHATCMVGYDDNKQMFKVQNSWGSKKGDKGFYWITYDIIRKKCLKGAYVLYGITGTPIISGSDIICDQEAYTIENLPTGAKVEWSIDSSHGYIKISSSGVVLKIDEQAEGEATITAKITTPSGDTFSISKTVTYISKYIDGYFETSTYPRKSYFQKRTHYAETSISISREQIVSIKLTKPSKLTSFCEFDWKFLRKPRCVERVYRNSSDNLIIDVSEPFITDVIEIKVSRKCSSEAYRILTIHLRKSNFYIYNISDGLLTIKNDESNSFKDVRSIEQDEVKREIKKVEIYNLQGYRVVNFTPSIFRKVFDVEIPISHLPSGFYALRVYDGKQWHKKKVWLK